MPQKKRKANNKKEPSLKLKRGKYSSFTYQTKRKLRTQFSSKVQSFGQGRTEVNITDNIELTMPEDGLVYTILNQAILADVNQEWERYKKDYNAYKVIGIAVSIYPNDTLDNSPTYLYMDWTHESLGENIEDNDNTKIVYNDAKRVRTYFFKPPNLQILIQSGNMFLNVNPSEPFQIRHNQNTTFYPGAIFIKQPAGSSLKASIQVRVVFLMPTIQTVLSKNELIGNQIVKRLLTEDEKKEEIKRRSELVNTFTTLRLVGENQRCSAPTVEIKEAESKNVVSSIEGEVKEGRTDLIFNEMMVGSLKANQIIAEDIKSKTIEVKPEIESKVKWLKNN
jgi:hypothetical protein